jgi:TM2 domain-containing membrane protein YozV
MPIELRCNECQRRLRVRDEIAGKRIKCPSCQAILRVPVPDDDRAVSAAALMAAPGPSDTPIPSDAPGPSFAPPPRSADAWHLKTADGATYGPVPRRELDSWFQEGRIDASCQLLEEGDASWKWASDVYPQLAPRKSDSAYPQPAAAFSPPAPAGAFDFAVDTHPGSRAGRPTRHSRHGHPSGDGSEQLSDKSKLVAGLLGLFLGVYGVHRFYLGYPGIGIAMLLTLGGCGIWSLIDSILVLTGSVRDPYGRPLRD